LPGVQVGKPLLAALDLLAAGGLLGLVRLGDFGQHQIRPFGIDGNRFEPRAQPGLQFFFPQILLFRARPDLVRAAVVMVALLPLRRDRRAATRAMGQPEKRKVVRIVRNGFAAAP